MAAVLSELRTLFCSPVPSQTISGFCGSSVTAPIDTLPCRSKIGVQVEPAFTVFHSPPEALAT